MAKINLLPWREELRKQKQQDFAVFMGMFVVLALAFIGAGHLYYVGQIEGQQQRNAYLNAEIAKLDQKIKAIKRLEKEKARLIARMRAIEQLQGNRPLVVRFFDELVNSLPDGVSVQRVAQAGKRITINGEAESNARVSSFMRNLEASDWLKDPDLDIIQAKNAAGQRVSAFTLTFKQVIPKAEGEGES